MGIRLWIWGSPVQVRYATPLIQELSEVDARLFYFWVQNGYKNGCGIGTKSCRNVDLSPCFHSAGSRVRRPERRRTMKQSKVGEEQIIGIERGWTIGLGAMPQARHQRRDLRHLADRRRCRRTRPPAG